MLENYVNLYTRLAIANRAGRQFAIMLLFAYMTRLDQFAAHQTVLINIRLELNNCLCLKINYSLYGDIIKCVRENMAIKPMSNNEQFSNDDDDDEYLISLQSGT